MSSEFEKSITIKLEIEIPIGAAVGQPIIKTKTGPAERVGLLGTTFSKPTQFNVQTRWDGNTGWICTSGVSIDELGGAATSVELRVVVGAVSPGSALMSGGTTVPVNYANGHWGEVEISGVTGYSDANLHTLLCWAHMQNGTIVPSAFIFQPVWSSATDCYPGFFLPPSTSTLANGQGGQTFELLPAAWGVRPRGFYGTPLSRLNGEWTLRLVSPSDFPLIYCSGGNGLNQPRIQLRCNKACSEVWELVLDAGGCRVTYSCPANGFDNQGRNVFQNATAIGIGEDCSIPAMISVVPI
ncbi:MAG: hypothetical protein JWM11_7886 [Planctomycetaceae bacterium]|nr:hypothetical protein [Planctomycetaceae bacterium]